MKKNAKISETFVSIKYTISSDPHNNEG